MTELAYFCDDARHLVCKPYSVENLHMMASELDIKGCWFHNATFPHYDIPKRRTMEIIARCTLINSKELLKIIKNGNIMPSTKWTPFKDIPDGRHFQDNHGRKFIKLASKSAVGFLQLHIRRVDGSVIGSFGGFEMPFNAVDYNGVAANCPDHVLFKLYRKTK